MLWSDRIKNVRTSTVEICRPLTVEDHVVQPRAEVSPPKWHLAHTTWFFERFLLKPFLKETYETFHPRFDFLFNSYYESVGERVAQGDRGKLSRPGVEEILKYRLYVDRSLERLLQNLATYSEPDRLEIQRRLELGCHHERQHQELLLMDILAIFAYDPSRPAYKASLAFPETLKSVGEKTSIRAGNYEVGFSEKGFSFDNEGPRHTVYLEDVELEPGLVTNRDFLEFIEDKGYERADLWLSDGWAHVKEQNWIHPLYWESRDSKWMEMGLQGLKALDPQAPVSHVSFYEADAFARWKNADLPTEFEWEVANRTNPKPWARWQWTRSSYSPYPRYRATRDAFGEYNGKFMSGQMVLRGGCQWTPIDHYRTTYRNFYQPEKRWPLTGIRLAHRK